MCIKRCTLVTVFRFRYNRTSNATCDVVINVDDGTGKSVVVIKDVNVLRQLFTEEDLYSDCEDDDEFEKDIIIRCVGIGIRFTLYAKKQKQQDWLNENKQNIRLHAVKCSRLEDIWQECEKLLQIL